MSSESQVQADENSEPILPLVMMMMMMMMMCDAGM
jgi:hypothetical protein